MQRLCSPDPDWRNLHRQGARKQFEQAGPLTFPIGEAALVAAGSDDIILQPPPRSRRLGSSPPEEVLQRMTKEQSSAGRVYSMAGLDGRTPSCILPTNGANKDSFAKRSTCAPGLGHRRPL
jgi:hypothetical protein